MRRNLRHLLAGATASLLIVGCGITSTKKSEDKDSEDASGVNAGATVNNQQFSLSLPFLPGIKPEAILKAHIRVYNSHVAFPQADVDCAAEASSQDSHPDAQPSVEPNSSVDHPDAKGGNGLTQHPVKPVYEDSMEYKVGASIGPIMLDPGLFTAILDVYDDQGKRYTGSSWFDVKQNVVSNIKMKMELLPTCGGSGGVVITPIVSGEPGDLVSACEFATVEIALCEKQETVCYYKDHKSHSHCGLRQARQQLVGSLCKHKVMVPKTFEKEVICEVSTKPQPEPPKPEPTKPTPPIMKSRACIQLDMGCDASEKVLGKGCSAKYKLFGSTVEEKTPLVNSGNYCKDRDATLKDLCGKNADTYNISCTKTP